MILPCGRSRQGWLRSASEGNIGTKHRHATCTGMTKELAKYVLEIRNDVQSKIKMLEPVPDMSALQAKKAQTLAEDCRRLDAALEQFMQQNLRQHQRKWAA